MPVCLGSVLLGPPALVACLVQRPAGQFRPAQHPVGPTQPCPGKAKVLIWGSVVFLLKTFCNLHLSCVMDGKVMLCFVMFVCYTCMFITSLILHCTEQYLYVHDIM